MSFSSKGTDISIAGLVYCCLSLCSLVCVHAWETNERVQENEPVQHLQNLHLFVQKFRINGQTGSPYDMHRQRLQETDRYNVRVGQTPLQTERSPTKKNSPAQHTDNRRTRDKHSSHVDTDNDDDMFFRDFDYAVDYVTHGGVKVDNSESNKCTCTKTNFIFCNCSNLNLDHIPVNDITKDVKGLDLSRNRIKNLTVAHFQRFPKLQYLSLQRNSIKNLPSGSFLGMEKLLVLDLRANELEMKNGTYADGIFKNLTSLIALRINRNTKNPKDVHLNYPGKALADLKALKLLSMDGLPNKEFGHDFQDMSSLKTLLLSGYLDGVCKLTSLTNNTFNYLRGLRVLDISNCHLRGHLIETGALLPLQSLYTLDVSWNQAMGFNNLARILSGVKHSNLRELSIECVESRYSPGTKIHAHFLENMPKNVTRLVASLNSINEIDPGVLGLLPKSLTHLDFSGNRMVFGEYLKNLTLLTNLDTLKIDGDHFPFRVPTSYPFIYPEALRDDEPALQSDEEDSKNNESLLILPPKLRVLSMQYAGLAYYLSRLSVGKNVLEELYLQGNTFNSLKGPFIGFNKLKRIDFSTCYIHDISYEFFNNFPDLQWLNLPENLLGFENSLSSSPFRNLSKLAYLNLNFNAIRHLQDGDTFIGLDALTELHLQDNPFVLFSPSISHMKRLQILNLNYTSVYTLGHATRTHLDSLANATVYLYETPLTCQCDNQNFMTWMSRSRAIPRHVHYKCILNSIEAMHRLPWNGFVDEVTIVKRQCAKNRPLFLIVLGVTVLGLVLTITSIAYRFRWRLRYVYYTFQLRLSKTISEAEEEQYTYDVFLSYSSDDLDFVLNKVCPELRSRDISVCVHSLDFLAGANITTNILRAIRHSRRTLIILTRSMIDSKWCRCEFQMAKEEAMITGRKILVFLLAEKIPPNKIGLDLLTHIQQNTYMPYPGNIKDRNSHRDADDQEDASRASRDMKTFWDKLARDLKP